MSDGNKVRLAHELLDEIDARKDLTPEQTEVLRSFLPERPKPVTLEQLRDRVHAAWGDAGTCTWDRDEYLDDFLLALRDDLSHLINEPKPTVPALPAGMRLAEHETYGRVVVSPGVDDDGTCKIFYLSTYAGDGSGSCWAPIDSLTFIDAKPARPEFLETGADYENAPQRTIVAIGDESPWVKLGAVWESATWNGRPSGLMADAPRRVLRWGWGE